MNKVMLGKNIRAARKKNGLTLRDMVEETGLGLGSLSEIENGNSDPKLSTIIKICSCLWLSFEDVLENCEED